MESLDLSLHEPDEFEGKNLEIDGRLYEFGARFRESDQGYAHQLINTQSGLCLHMIQIRPEYKSDPNLAKKLSLEKQKLTAGLRSKMRLEKPGVSIPSITVVDTDAGVFELHETDWGAFSGEADRPPTLKVLRQAQELEQSGDAQAAMTLIQSLLDENPLHSEALTFKANLLLRQGSPKEAIQLAKQVTEIEPNSARYQAGLAFFLMQGDNPDEGIFLFESFQKRYPHIDDYNSYLIRGYIETKHYEKAKKLLNESSLTEDQKQNLARALTAAQSGVSYAVLEIRVQSNEFEGKVGAENLESLLRQALAIEPSNPWVYVNLGLTLKRLEQYGEAASYLNAAMPELPPELSYYCSASIAQCLVGMEEWETALSSYDTTFDLLNIATQGKYKALDVPGNVEWLHKSGMIAEKAIPPPGDPLRKAVASCEDSSLITPRIKKLLALYEELDSLYAQRRQSATQDKNARGSKPPFDVKTALLVSAVMVLFSFTGTFTLFLQPFRAETVVFGGLVLLPVIVGITATLRKPYIKKHQFFFFTLIAVPFLAMVGGTLAAY